MAWELACQALDQIAQHRIGQNIYLNYLGEPLLYPHLFELVQYAHSLNLTTHTITNGSLLDSRRIEQIRNSALSDIKISYETPDAETFKLRGTRHHTHQQILQNLLNLIHALKDTSKKIGIVYMTTLPGQKRGIENIQIISSLPQLQQEIATLIEQIQGITSVQDCHTLQTHLNQIDWHWWNPVIWLNDTLYLEIRPTLNWGNTMTQQPIIPTTTGYCDALKEKMGILVNGDVVICCIDYEGEQVIGNISQTPLIDILNSDLARQIRRDFDNHIVSLKKCQICLGTAVEV